MTSKTSLLKGNMIMMAIILIVAVAVTFIVLTALANSGLQCVGATPDLCQPVYGNTMVKP